MNSTIDFSFGSIHDDANRKIQLYNFIPRFIVEGLCIESNSRVINVKNSDDVNNAFIRLREKISILL